MEVEAFAKWVRPTEAEVKARETVIQNTMDIARQNLGIFTKFNPKIEPFGSARNGLGLVSSDIDLRLYRDHVVDSNHGSWMPEAETKLPPQRRIRRLNESMLAKLQGVF